MSAPTADALARDRIERFVRRFGEPYRRLAWYAALPLVLTPELIGYLRLHFLGDRSVPWIAEADLLLSDLCRPVGYEQYAMDQPVRACLIAEMRTSPRGPEAMREAARLLLRYVRYLGRSGAGLGPAELEAERWSAMAYLDEHRGQAAREIAAAFAASLVAGLTVAIEEPAAIGISAAELARLVHIADELAVNLADHRELLEYAGEIGRLLSDPEALRGVGERFAQSGGAVSVRIVEGVVMPELVPDSVASPVLECDAGAVPLDSRFYVERETDAELWAAVARRDTIVLVKGSMQMGKTSLLARTIAKARLQGMQVVFIDLQGMDPCPAAAPTSASAFQGPYSLALLPFRNPVNMRANPPCQAIPKRLLARRRADRDGREVRRTCYG